MIRTARCQISVLVALMAALPAWAVKSQSWLHTEPKDFIDAQMENLVVTSHGEIMLGRSCKTLYVGSDELGAFNDLARANDGKIYAATGPEGVVYRIDSEQVREFAKLPDGSGTILSLAFTHEGFLLAGTGGGKQARIYLIDGDGKSKVFFEPPGATYIWDMARGEQGEIYAATGIEGQLFVIDAAGNGKLLSDVKPRNLLCVALGPDGMIYAGTDEEGLVYRFNPTTGKPYVLYDAKEPEISCITVDAAGNIFAATADAERAKPGRAVPEKKAGHPEESSNMPGQSKPANTKKADRKDKGEDKSEKPTTQASEDGANAGEKAKDANDAKPADQMKDAGKNGEDDSAEENQKETQDGEAADEESPKQPSFVPDADKLDDGDDDGGVKKLKEESAGAITFSLPKSLGMSLSGASAPSVGNAIYRIDVDGFVTEVFREPVMILDMVEADGTLYAVTGNEGRLYGINPAKEQVAMLNKFKPLQATSLLRLPDGRFIVGTANAAMLLEISDGFADKGTLTSTVLDAGQIVKWGRIGWHATIPTGTKMTVATRSGNVQDEESEAWEAWSTEMDATSPQQMASAGARYLQYRLTLESTVADASPSLDRIQISRIEENRAPLASGLEIVSAAVEAQRPGGSIKIKGMLSVSSLGSASDEKEPEPQYLQIIKWKAEDPNGDTLSYDVFYRLVGETKWIRLAKEQKEDAYLWDSRTVPDGKYEVRLLADDSRSNPSGTNLTYARISNPILIDNTPPDATIDEIVPAAARAVRLHVVLKDALSPIVEASYAVDSSDKWRALVADDDIFDTTSEATTFTVDDLEPGEHRISVRVRDEQGNTRYVSQTVTIE